MRGGGGEIAGEFDDAQRSHGLLSAGGGFDIAQQPRHLLQQGEIK